MYRTFILIGALCSAPIQSMDAPKVWKQINWTDVEPENFTVEDRIQASDNILNHLRDTITRLAILNIDEDAKSTIIQKIEHSINRCEQCKAEAMDVPHEELKKRLFDSFLTPYHAAEPLLRNQVEHLAASLERNDPETVDALVLDLLNLSL